MTAKEEIANRIKKYREEVIEKVLEIVLKDIPLLEQSEEKDLFLTGLNVAINHAYQNPSLTYADKVELSVKQIAIQTMFCEQLYWRSKTECDEMAKPPMKELVN